MAKGRPADPKAVQRGTARAKRKPKADVTLVAVDAPLYPPPAGLPESVHPVWFTAVSEMGGNRHLREVDLVLLKVWCEAVHAHDEASRYIHEYGVLVKGPSGPKANPMIAVQDKTAATIRQLSEVLGLNPITRIRMGLMELSGRSQLADLNAKLDSD